MSPQKKTKIQICKTCVVMSTRPRISFDKKGFCNACQWRIKKKTINWKKREREFIEIAKQIRSKRKNFDIVVPVSGGKDSNYVAYNLKHKYKLNPVFVTVNPPLHTQIGKKNLQKFIKKGFNLISLDPNPKNMQKVNKEGMISFGQPYYGWLTAIHTAVFNLTSKLGIDLIMYGEDGEVEYGGTTKTQNRFLYDNKYVEQVYLSDVYKKIFKKIKLNQDDKFFYELSSSKRIKHCHYSYFENWDPYRNYLFAKDKFDMEEDTKTSASTFTNFAQTDQKLYGLHTYFMFLKFGFGRSSQDAGIEVRRGAMTRDQAIALVQLYDHLFPKKYLKDYLKYFEISNNQLNKIIDKFANKKVLVKEKNYWKQNFIYT